MIKDIIDKPSHVLSWYVCTNDLNNPKIGAVYKSDELSCKLGEQRYCYKGDEVEVFLREEDAVERFIHIAKSIPNSNQLKNAIETAIENGIDLTSSEQGKLLLINLHETTKLMGDIE